MFFGRKGNSKKFELQGSVVTGGSNNLVEFWNPKTGTRIHQITSPRYTQYCYDFLNPTQMIAGTDQVAMLINLKKKTIERQFTGHTSFIWSIRSINQDRFVTAGGDTTCRVWSAKRGSELASFRHTSGNLRGVRVLKTLPGRVASCGSDGFLKIWNLKKSKEEYSLDPQPHGQVWDCEDDKRSRMLICGGYTQPYLFFYDTRNLKKKFKVTGRLSNYITCMVNIAEKREVWAGCNDGNVYIYDYRKLNSHRLQWKPSPSCIYRMKRMGGRFSHHVLIGGMDYNCRIFDLKKLTKSKQTAIREWRTNTYVYGLAYCGKSKGSNGPLLSYNFQNSTPHQLQAQRMKFYKEEDERFEYVMKNCFDEGRTDLEFVLPQNKNLVWDENFSPKLGFWSYFFHHCPQLMASLENRKKIVVETPCPLEVRQDLILKFILLKKKNIGEMLLSEESLVDLEDSSLDEDEDELLSSIPLFEDEIGEESEISEEDKDNSLDSVFFTLSQKRSFLDYFIFFRNLKCSYEMLSVLFEISKISQLELLLLLFLKCVREYEPPRIQRLFLPLDELRILEQERKEKLSGPPPKTMVEKTDSKNEDEDEDEYDDQLLQNLEKKLYSERQKKLQKVEKIQEKKRKREERKKLRQKKLLEKKTISKKKLVEEEISDDSELEEEEEEEEEGEEIEEDELFGASSYLFSDFDDVLVDESIDEKDNDGEDLLDSVKETVFFETSFCHFLFFMMKDREEDIRSNSRLLKYFIQVLEQLERCEVQPLQDHKDFASLRMKNFKSQTSTSKKIDSKSSSYSTTTFLGQLKESLYSGEAYNLILECSNSKKQFKVHKEILLLKSPYFYDLIKNKKYVSSSISKKKDGGEEDDGEMDEEEDEIKKKSIELMKLNLDEDELFLIIQFIYCGEISKFSGDMKVILKLMNHGQIYNDQRLIRSLIIYLIRVFKTKKKRMIVSFIVEHGHLLESDQLQRKFSRAMENIEMGSDADTFDEKEMEILLHKSIKKYKVDNVIRKLKEENKELKRKNKLLEDELTKLKEKQ